MIIKYSEYIKEGIFTKNTQNTQNTKNTTQFFTTYEETKDWLDKMEIKNYTINDDLTVDVDGRVDISNKNLKYIPVKFSIVKGDFNLLNNKLTTLIGTPKEVGGFFLCYSNPLTSLEGLSIYNLKEIITLNWYIKFNSKIKEEYFDIILEDNPETISLIDFNPSDKFKDKWEHLFNANKFDLI
jgi:hypothetical protein